MKLSIPTVLNAILMATFATQSTALLVPEGQADGIYTAKIDSQGELLPGTQVELIRAIDRREFEGDSSSTAHLTTPNRLNARQLPNPVNNCHDRWINIRDYECVMNTRLNAWGDNRDIASNTARWAICGTAVVYMCNYSSQGNPVRAQEFRTANSIMNSGCGTVKAGWVVVNDWNKDYGRDTTGHRICKQQFLPTSTQLSNGRVASKREYW